MLATFTQSPPVPAGWKQLYDEVYDTKSPNLWVVREKGGEAFGLLDKDTETFLIPAEYDLIDSTTTPWLWVVEKNDRQGVYDSVKKVFLIHLGYNFIDTTNVPYLWIMMKEDKCGICKYGIYNSNTEKMETEFDYEDIYVTDDLLIFFATKDGIEGTLTLT